MNKILLHLKTEWYKYFLEIIVVVLGILVAYSLNNWNETVKDKRNERQLYSDLLLELRNDLNEIQGNRRYNNWYLSRFNYASEIILNDPQMQLADSLGVIATELTNFSDFEKEVSAYDMLAASGKLEIFKNKIILQELQRLGNLYTYINRLEKNHEQLMFMTVPQITEYIRINPLKIMKKDHLYSYQFHNQIGIFIHIGIEKDGLYERAENELNNLISALEQEID